jgi:hypothetical protein
VDGFTIADFIPAHSAGSSARLASSNDTASAGAGRKTGRAHDGAGSGTANDAFSSWISASVYSEAEGDVLQAASSATSNNRDFIG